MEIININEVIDKLVIPLNDFDKAIYVLNDRRVLNPTEIMNDCMTTQIRYFNIFALEFRKHIFEYFKIYTTDKDEEKLRPICKQAYSDVCQYVDKLLSLLRFVFYIDKQKTTKIIDLLPVLEIYKNQGYKSLENFRTLFFDLYNDENYKYINDCRNNEEHNTSPFEKRAFDFTKGDGKIITRYEISSDVFFGRVLKILDKLIILKDKVMEVLLEIDKNKPLTTALAKNLHKTNHYIIDPNTRVDLKEYH